MKLLIFKPTFDFEEFGSFAGGLTSLDVVDRRSDSKSSDCGDPEVECVPVDPEGDIRRFSFSSVSLIAMRCRICGSVTILGPRSRYAFCRICGSVTILGPRSRYAFSSPFGGIVFTTWNIYCPCTRDPIMLTSSGLCAMRRNRIQLQCRTSRSSTSMMASVQPNIYRVCRNR